MNTVFLRSGGTELQVLGTALKVALAKLPRAAVHPWLGVAVISASQKQQCLGNRGGDDASAPGSRN